MLQNLFGNTSDRYNRAPYNHTQYSTLIPLIILAGILVMLILAFKDGGNLVPFAGMAFLFGCFIPLFSSLTVRVATNQLYSNTGLA